MKLPELPHPVGYYIVGLGEEKNLSDLWISISELCAQSCLPGTYEIYDTADAWEVEKSLPGGMQSRE